MDEPYRRPDRAEIAARVRAELAEEREEPAAAAAPPQIRCEACGYLTGSIGHRVACDE